MIMSSMIAFLELGLDDLIPESKGTLSHLWSVWPSNTLHVKFRPLSLSPLSGRRRLPSKSRGCDQGTAPADLL